jgi:hypothetical protein
MNRTHHPAAVEPRTARVSSRTSGEGAPVRPSTPPARPRPATATAQLLRHNLVSPEKKTLKRIEGIRRDLRAGSDEDGVTINETVALARIVEHLRADRGIAGQVTAEGFVGLGRRLVDPTRASSSAAAIVGDWLREIGGIERGTVTPDRIKRALAILQDALYAHDDIHAPIPASVRDVKLEKRDGGLQILAALRIGADEAVVIAALRQTLDRAGYVDVVVRAQPATTNVARA